MLKRNVLNKEFLAFSREPGLKKVSFFSFLCIGYCMCIQSKDRRSNFPNNVQYALI